MAAGLYKVFFVLNANGFEAGRDFNVVNNQATPIPTNTETVAFGASDTNCSLSSDKCELIRLSSDVGSPM
jgi:hypothetical protein